jgi:histidine triad (HIT) family protein
MTADSDCLFCKMASGDFPVDIVYQDDAVFAIMDIAPRAPKHLLVIPKQHIESARSLDGAADGPLLGRMIGAANLLAEQAGVKDSGYRLTFNVGEDGGQTIYHLHLHVLGGQKLGPEG